MPTISKNELRRRVELDGLTKTRKHLINALKRKHLKPTDFRIRDLAESLVTDDKGKPVGKAWVEQLGPQKSGGVLLVEASAGVSLSGFNNITGQILYTRVMEGYQQDEFIWPQLVEEYQTDFNGEKIPGVTGITENVSEVAENMPYPEVGFGDDYIETPVTTKRGFILSITKETIFFDRTNLVLRQAGTIGNVMGLKKEKMILDLVLGVTNSYKWRGTSYNTYQAATPWINLQSGIDSGATTFDWTAIDTIEQLFVDMLDPNTGEPIIINPKNILAMPARKHTFRRVLNATLLRHSTNTAAIQTESGNVLDSYNLMTSRMAYRRLIASGVSAANAKNTWLMGEFKKAFGWQYNWPLQVVQAPNNHEAEFKQDIQFRWKASERGSGVVFDPRYVVKVYNA